MPDVYRLPGDGADSVETSYMAVCGDRSIINSDKPIGFGAITDGTSNTIAVIEYGTRGAWEPAV